MMSDGHQRVGRKRSPAQSNHRAEQDCSLHQKRIGLKRRTCYKSNPQFLALWASTGWPAANQVLVCDCTYLRLRGRQFAYLFLVSDAYTRRIVGHHASRDLSHYSAVIALSKAAAWLQEVQGVTGQGMIHHSDRGCQYCCHEYLAMLRSYGMESSMTDADHCYQNAIAERINGILKDEFNLDAEFADINQLQTAVEQAVEVYNTQRTHWSLGLRTPQEMYAQARRSTPGRRGTEGTY